MISINNWMEQQIQIQRDAILDSIYPDFLPQPKDLCEHIKHNLDRCDDVQFDYDLNDTDIQDIIEHIEDNIR